MYLTCRTDLFFLPFLSLGRYLAKLKDFLIDMSEVADDVDNVCVCEFVCLCPCVYACACAWCVFVVLCTAHAHLQVRVFATRTGRATRRRAHPHMHEFNTHSCMHVNNPYTCVHVNTHINYHAVHGAQPKDPRPRVLPQRHCLLGAASW